jgi:futalosine hydrolase
MRTLIVAATEQEIAGVVAAIGRSSDRHDVLVTGVGMVATAARCSRAIARTPYDCALNFGVCGSFDRALVPGTVVHVVSDRIAELGAQDGDAFMPIEALNLLGADDRAELVNAAPPDARALQALPQVRGITVNTVHGDDRSIAEAVRRFDPQVESMEGAAFMYACTIGGVPFAQVRAVSNIVERRNRAAWRLQDAIAALNAAALAIADQL